MMRKNRQDMLTPLCQLATYVLLIASVLFLVYVGSHLFHNVTRQKEQNEHLRSTVSYIQNQIAANDSENGVSVSEGPEGDMLVLELPEQDYAVYLYTFKGYLTEELVAGGSTFDPEQGEKISPVESFKVEELNGRRMHVSIDGASAWITLRCGEGSGSND